MNRKILISAVTAAVLFVGCGSGTSDTTTTTSSNTTSTTTQNVSGVVADGYIKGAVVCLDLNNNNECDAGEPQTVTDANGNYKLAYDGDLDGKTIIAENGFDIDRNTTFESKLVTQINGNSANITPLTTFAYAYAKENGVSFDEASNKVASILGINSSDITSDPVKNDNLEKVSLNLQLMVEAAAKLENTFPTDIYLSLAQKAKNATSLEDIVNQIDNENIKTVLNYINAQNIDMSNIQNFENNINTAVNLAKSAIDNNNTVISEDAITTAIQSNQLVDSMNLSFQEWSDKVNSLIGNISANKNISNTATKTDVENLLGKIRDITYEFTDPNIDNQESNTSTVAGEVLSNYKNYIKPAVNNVENDINDSVTKVNNTINQFNNDFNTEFNTTVERLNNRLNEINNVLNEYNETTDFNATTPYGDKISHIYKEDSDGYITDIYTLNDKNLTAKYYKNETAHSFLATDPVTLSEDGNYSISLNALSFDGSKFDFNVSGVVYDPDDNTKKIEISSGTVSFDADTSYMDTSITPLEGISNVNVDFNANVITKNGSANAQIILNDNKKEIIGTLDYSNFNGVKLNGTITLNANTSNLLKMAEDDDKKFDNGGWLFNDLFFVNGSLVKDVNVTYDIEDNGTSWTDEYNLTAFNGDVAHCRVTDNFYTHNVTCDTNVTSYYIGDKVVTAEIDGKEYYLDDICDLQNDSDIIKLAYSFKAPNSNYLITPDTNYNVSDIEVRNPTTALDVVGDVKFSGIVVTDKVNAELNLTAQSLGDGKTYNIIASGVKLTDGNNQISVDYAQVTNQQIEEQQYGLFDNYIRNYDESDDTNTTEVLLKGINATLYDTQNNPVKLSDLNALINADTKNANIYGTVSYLDFNLSGFIGGYETDNKYSVTAYLNVHRVNYEPFTLGIIGSGDENSSSVKTAISYGNYGIYLESNTNNDNTTVTGYDSNGVVLHIQSNNEDVNITDKNGNSLATFDSKTKTINYNDGSSETLY